MRRLLVGLRGGGDGETGNGEGGCGGRGSEHPKEVVVHRRLGRQRARCRSARHASDPLHSLASTWRASSSPAWRPALNRWRGNPNGRLILRAGTAPGSAPARPSFVCSAAGGQRDDGGPQARRDPRRRRGRLSRLTSADEDRTLARLRALREATSSIRRSPCTGDEVVKRTGDGISRGNFCQRRRRRPLRD